MSQIKIKVKDTITLGKVKEDIVDSVESPLNPFRVNIVVVDDAGEHDLVYWLESDAFVAANISEDGKTLYMIIESKFNELLLIVFDVIQ